MLSETRQDVSTARRSAQLRQLARLACLTPYCAAGHPKPCCCPRGTWRGRRYVAILEETDRHGNTLQVVDQDVYFDEGSSFLTKKPRRETSVVCRCFANPVLFQPWDEMPVSAQEEFRRNGPIPCEGDGLPGLWCSACRFGTVTPPEPV